MAQVSMSQRSAYDRESAFLAEQASKGQLVLFVGAGASRDADLPDWQSLMRPLIQDLGVSTDTDLLDAAQMMLAQDFTFKSPSMAASVMLGRNSNGRTDWRDQAGVPLKEIQAGQVGAVTR